MKNISKIFFAIGVFCMVFDTNAQSTCAVNKLGIEKNYEGECKKGLANGKGKATGVDQYEGNFKKGMPDGYGVYTWANGNQFKGEWKKGRKEGKGELTYIIAGKDSLVAGYWIDDEYIGINENRYEVVSASPDVESVQFTKKGDTPVLILIFTLRFNRITPRNLFVSDINGSPVFLQRGVTYRDIVYPWEGNIRFSYVDEQTGMTPAADGSSVKDVDMQVRINTPGTWEVRIDLRDSN